MNIDHASAGTFVRPAASPSRLRSFLFALGLAAFALVALLVTVVLLFLSARSQMRFQVSPTDIKYAPPQRIPAANENKNDSKDRDDDEAGPAIQPSLLPGIIPGFPGIGAGPLFPASPPAPAYTPAPSRTEPDPRRESTAPRVDPAPTVPGPAADAAPRPPRSRASGPAGGNSTRRVGSKTFTRDSSGVLVDSAYDAAAGLETITLVAGSDPYVRLLESRPDLRQYFRLDDQLIVVVDKVVYCVLPKD